MGKQLKLLCKLVVSTGTSNKDGGTVYKYPHSEAFSGFYNYCKWLPKTIFENKYNFLNIYVIKM